MQFILPFGFFYEHLQTTLIKFWMSFLQFMSDQYLLMA